jgi:hypothetical protein
VKNPTPPREQRAYIERLRNTPPPLAIEPIKSEGNADWNGPQEKAPLPGYPNDHDKLERDL